MMNQPLMSPRTPRWQARLAAATVLAVAAALATTAHAQAADPRSAAQLEACLAKAAEKPDEALEDALVWRARSGGVDAEHCLAVARIERGDIGEVAETLASLAASPRAGSDTNRAMFLAKAANAWMLAESYAAAEGALTQAIAYAPEQTSLYTDRAQARALMRRWSDAEADLDRALALRPDPFAYRLRAEVRMQQARLDAADADLAEALRLEPGNIDSLVVRGRIREARRLGHAPD